MPHKMLGKDLENFSKTMEKWHNRIFPPLTILLTASCMLLSAVALLAYEEQSENLEAMWNESDSPLMPYFVFQIFFYLGAIGMPLYLLYTKIFTKFNFPIDFKGDGRSRKIKPIVPQ